jgi:hypothetical protein
MLVPAPATTARKRRVLPRAATIAALGIGAAFTASSPARAAV